ncbi:uncharacterized protein LOC109407518 isoform X1 [Aedes albopictus]|uniref:Uncharacterized protein n=1 Tax=Aedes albopictus TaxID=7160 RepID=A0ABM2A3Z7_AEDAL|nr:uncharacterized protein LOC109407518 isoform X1 [Aedes albopictus]
MDLMGEVKCNIDKSLEGNSREMECEAEPEKNDLSPENSKKSDNSPLDDRISRPDEEKNDGIEEKMQYNNGSFNSGVSDNSNVNKSISMQEIEKSQRSVSEDPDVRNALAFTIEFSEGRKAVDIQRHEKMLERFQNRHKRGVSLSKLESGLTPPTGKMRTPQSVNLPRRNRADQSEIQDTAVRLRDKSRASRDSVNKRHSWSPRSSMMETGAKDMAAKANTNKFTPKSSALQMAFDQQNIMKDSCSSSEFNAESLDSSIGLPCIEPPLENFKKENDDDDSVSEAGTYTLDGDNYTEEQKERMNIDRMPAFTPESTPKPLFKQGANKPYPQRPTNFQDELEIIDLDRPCSGPTANERRKNNVLEVVYFHEPSPVAQVSKPKLSYIEKLKSRMKNITHKAKSPDKQIVAQQTNSPDQGTFTSVTTSGILSVKPTLENHPRIHRRNSLTKSHIDSSEYVQGVAKLNIHKNEEEAKILNCYTDSEKATCLSDLNVNYDHPRHKADSEASAIGSAVSKKDWIQEWAKNAREYSKKPTSGSAVSTNNPQMVRSYDFENRNQFGYDFEIDMTKSDYYDTKKYQEFGDNLDRQHLHRKQLDRLLNNSSNSDPMMKQPYGTDSSAPSSGEFIRRGSIRQYTSPTAAKPPMSPSKIPSPMGSIGRARSVSRNRSLQGSNSDLSTNETEMYLQKTAAAISTLQNLQRRNSLRNSSRQNSSHSSPLSPASRRMSPKISPMNSLQSPVHSPHRDKILHADGGQPYLPHHQQILTLKQQQNLLNHKRNLSLDGTESYANALAALGYGNQMSNSLNSENMNAILDLRKQHTRHNSFEGMSSLPPKPVKCFQNFDQRTAYYCAKDQNEGMPRNDMADYDDDEKLIVITSAVKDMSLGAKKQSAVLIKQQPSSSFSGKASGAQMRSTGSQPVNKPYNPKPVPTQISSPIKRSSSFSVKAMKPSTPTLTPKLGSKAATGGSRIQKSASSTSFKKMVANYNDEDEFYINDDDDLELGPEYSSSSEISDKDEEAAEVDKEPITNTKYNKTFLMRMEQNKKIAAGVKHGVAACPNTPELPRRTLQVKGNTRDRASMPRDSSLNRMKQDMGASRKSMGRESVPKEPTGGKQKVQPKYLDISKYKNPSAGNFLKKDESKSYLLKPEVKKSPSSASVAMNRAEPSRMSTRSIKSAGAKPTASNQKVTKEQELEMWRRRASYDPMKAAMEGKKKQEEARRHVQNQAERTSKSCESSVLRSQSCHSGVGVGTGRLYSSNISNNTNSNIKGIYDQTDNNSNSSQPSNHWTLTSTESSDDFDDEYNN